MRGFLVAVGLLMAFGGFGYSAYILFSGIDQPVFIFFFIGFIGVVLVRPAFGGRRRSGGWSSRRRSSGGRSRSSSRGSWSSFGSSSSGGGFRSFGRSSSRSSRSRSRSRSRSTRRKSGGSRGRKGR